MPVLTTSEIIVGASFHRSNSAIILSVDAQLVKRLLQLNQDFYSRFAGEFSASRAADRLNVEPLIPYLKDGMQVLDIGCGNGRLAERLEQDGYVLDYVGIDAAPELVAIANAKRPALKRIRTQFRVADITARGWSGDMAADQPFDRAVAFAVLHHIPSLELRRVVLQEIRTLLKPSGIFVMSNWQFTRNARLRNKIVPWTTVGIDGDRLEPGDALLDWKRGGEVFRYCHLLTEQEIEKLAGVTGFTVIRQFLADQELNLYSILQAS